MDIALVTGADAGPGLAIARRLIGMGCRVYALATQFARNPFPHDDFIPLTVNLADPVALTEAVEKVLAQEGHVSFVVHAARRVATPLLDSPVEALTERLHVGLLAPIVLARVALPWLRKEKGHFLALCWNGDGLAPAGPVSAAIEGGLNHFTSQLFDELREDGVRATTLYARPNPETSAEAALALDPQSAVNPELVADAVEQLFRLRPSNVISTLIIRPAANAESPRLPRSTELAGLATREVQLPAREFFPREPEPIPTPRRARPADAPPPGTEDVYDDEDEDEEDDEWNPEGDSAQAGDDRDYAPSSDGPRRDDGPPRSEGGPPRSENGPPRGDSGPRREYYDDRGPRQGQGPGPGQGRRSRGGRGRSRGGRGGERGGDRGGDRQFTNNRRGDLNGPGRDRPHPDAQRSGPPTREGDRPPQGRDEFSDRDRPPADREDFSDRDREEAARSARDDSFRTPHSDNEPDDLPNDDTDFESPAGDDRPGGSGERPPQNFRDSDDAPGPDRDLESVPARDGDYARRERAPAPRPASSGQRPQPDYRPGSDRRSDSDNRPSSDYRPERSGPPQGSGASRGPGPSQPDSGPSQQGSGPRRHRGYGRRPPPNPGGAGASHDRD